MAAQDWPHLVAVIGVLTLLGGTLLLGALLQVKGTPETGPSGPAWPQTERREGSAPTTDDPSRPSLPRLPAAVSPPPAALDGPALAEGRATQDEERLAGSPRDWTLQFLLACDVDNVMPILEELGARSELYLLSTRYEGRSCYRVCWGRYGSRQAAETASGLPPRLTSIAGKPLPVSVERALR